MARHGASPLDAPAGPAYTEVIRKTPGLLIAALSAFPPSARAVRAAPAPVASTGAATAAEAYIPPLRARMTELDGLFARLGALQTRYGDPWRVDALAPQRTRLRAEIATRWVGFVDLQDRFEAAQDAVELSEEMRTLSQTLGGVRRGLVPRDIPDLLARARAGHRFMNDLGGWRRDSERKLADDDIAFDSAVRAARLRRYAVLGGVPAFWLVLASAILLVRARTREVHP